MENKSRKRIPHLKEKYILDEAKTVEQSALSQNESTAMRNFIEAMTFLPYTNDESIQNFVKKHNHNAGNIWVES